MRCDQRRPSRAEDARQNGRMIIRAGGSIDRRCPPGTGSGLSRIENVLLMTWNSFLREPFALCNLRK